MISKSYSREELLDLIKTLVEADSTKSCSYLKMSKNNWETLGRPLVLLGKEVIPVAGFPDERIYIEGET